MEDKGTIVSHDKKSAPILCDIINIVEKTSGIELNVLEIPETKNENLGLFKRGEASHLGGSSHPNEILSSRVYMRKMFHLSETLFNQVNGHGYF